ncbi:hypothetical protein VTI74DRAFT_7532 [Chaetomium olivicolor]
MTSALTSYGRAWRSRKRPSSRLAVWGMAPLSFPAESQARLGVGYRYVTAGSQARRGPLAMANAPWRAWEIGRHGTKPPGFWARVCGQFRCKEVETGPHPKATRGEPRIDEPNRASGVAGWRWGGLCGCPTAAARHAGELESHRSAAPMDGPSQPNSAHRHAVIPAHSPCVRDVENQPQRRLSSPSCPATALAHMPCWAWDSGLFPCFRGQKVNCPLRLAPRDHLESTHPCGSLSHPRLVLPAYGTGAVLGHFLWTGTCTTVRMLVDKLGTSSVSFGLVPARLGFPPPVPEIRSAVAEE